MFTHLIAILLLIREYVNWGILKGGKVGFPEITIQDFT